MESWITIETDYLQQNFNVCVFDKSAKTHTLNSKMNSYKFIWPMKRFYDKQISADCQKELQNYILKGGSPFPQASSVCPSPVTFSFVPSNLGSA